jgi:transposase
MTLPGVQLGGGMAFREVGVLEVKEVLRLSRDGVAKKRVARQLGLDVKTVRRYLELAGAVEVEAAGDLDAAVAAVVGRLGVNHGRPRSEHWEACRAQRGFIESHLSHGVRLTKIRRLLKRRGMHVSYATLNRFAIEELGFGRRAPTIPVADCGPGEEVQLDTGRVGWLRRDDAGHRRYFKAWIFTAVRSRHRFVYPVPEETTATAIEACEAAWGFFGGVFKVVIPDNTKTIVNEADPLEPKLNQDFLEYAQSRGFHIDPTRVRSPKDKARVERAVQPVREDCYGGEDLSSIEEALAHGIRWCLEEYGMRRHSTTQRRPREQFEAEERPALLPAPAEPYDIPAWSKPKVGPDQHAQVEKALYSLPRRYRGRKLDARADRHTVRFYERKVLVKTHPRVGPGQRQTDAADFPPEQAACALRDRGFFERRAAEHGEHVGLFAKRLLDGPLPWTRMRQVFALLSLVRRYGAPRVDQACALALNAEMLSVHRLRRLLEIAPVSTPTSPARVIPIARYLRPPEQYRLSLVLRERPTKGDPV